MKYYVGLDVGHSRTSISMIDATGARVFDTAVPTDPDAIADALKPYRRQCVRVGIESCSVAVWLAPALAKKHIPIVCIEARHAHLVLKARINKTDKNDARGLADLMRTGTFKVVHLKSPETRRLQTMLTVRRVIQLKYIDIENAIGGIVRSFGLKAPRGYLDSYDSKVRATVTGQPDLARLIEPLLLLRRALLDQFTSINRDLTAYAKADPVCQRLMTAPGVGPFVAVMYKAVIDVPERFRRSQTVGAHVGLTPRTIQSGDSVFRTGISKCGDMELRRALYLAGWAVTHTRNSPNPLREWGEAIAARSSKNRAIIAIARRLAVILHRMWSDGTDYQARSMGA